MSEWNTSRKSADGTPYYQGYYFISSYPQTTKLYLVKIRPGKFEIWKLTNNHSGDRYISGTYKCLSTHKTLKAAKLAYKISMAAGLDKS